MAGMLASPETLYQSPQLLDVYNRLHERESGQGPKSIVEGIEYYCFPKGVQLQLVHEDEVKRLKRAQAAQIRSHVLQFRDVVGTPTYGAVVVRACVAKMMCMCAGVCLL